MINTFLTTVLGYKELEEIKTEYMIKGTYSDYMVQVEGKRYFLVEVKAFALQLSEKHLRQTVNYGANEGIEWAILTNGHQFHFYRILFEKPINEKLVFHIDFNAEDYNVKNAVEQLEYFHRDAVIKNGLENLWSRFTALDPEGIASMLFSPQIITFLKKELKAKHNIKFEDDEIVEALTEVVCSEIPHEKLKVHKIKAPKKKMNKVMERIDPPSETMPSPEGLN